MRKVIVIIFGFVIASQSFLVDALSQETKTSILDLNQAPFSDHLETPA